MHSGLYPQPNRTEQGPHLLSGTVHLAGPGASGPGVSLALSCFGGPDPVAVAALETTRVVALGGVGCAAPGQLGRPGPPVGYVGRPAGCATRGHYRLHRAGRAPDASAARLGRGNPLGTDHRWRGTAVPPTEACQASTHATTRSIGIAKATNSDSAQRGRTTPHVAQPSGQARPATRCIVGAGFIRSGWLLLTSAGSLTQHAGTR